MVNGAGQDAGEEEDAEEDEEDAQDAMLESGAIPDEAQLKLEKQHLRMLVDAFDPEQAERYDMWRRVKLNKAVVRRVCLALSSLLSEKERKGWSNMLMNMCAACQSDTFAIGCGKHCHGCQWLHETICWGID